MVKVVGRAVGFAAVICVASGLRIEVDWDSISASHAGGAQSFAVDMNPFAPSANTATSLSVRQTCARIDVNGVQNADEDGVDIVLVDVTASQFPIQVLGFEYHLSYPEAHLTVQAYDQNFFLTATAGSSLFDGSEPVPDTDGNNEWSGIAMDTADNTHETGSGVLHRVTFGADQGAAPGLYTVGFVNGMNGHADPNNNGFVPDNLYGGTIAIGTSYCPNTDSDGDGVFDADEAVCGGSVYNAALRPERIDLAGDDDGDTLVNEPLPPGSENNDCDGDGYKGSAENNVYLPSILGDQDSCGWAPTSAPFGIPIGWPADLRGGFELQREQGEHPGPLYLHYPGAKDQYVAG